MLPASNGVIRSHPRTLHPSGPENHRAVEPFDGLVPGSLEPRSTTMSDNTCYGIVDVGHGEGHWRSSRIVGRSAPSHEKRRDAWAILTE